MIRSTLFLFLCFITIVNSIEQYCSKNKISSLPDKTFIENCLTNTTQSKNILKLFDRLFKNHSNELNYLFLDLVYFTKLLSENNKNCLNTCELLKDCEFPIRIEHDNWKQDISVVASLASFLSILDNPNDTNLIDSLLKTTLFNNNNIYDVKIYLDNAYEATKNSDNSLNFKLSTINNNLNWYSKWTNEVKTINNIKIDDKSLAKIYKNSKYNFVSNVSFDCFNFIWYRLISVPIINKNGIIIGATAISISLNNYDIRQCDDENDLNNSFKSTAKCDTLTSECLNIGNKGLTRGSYLCKCKKGYYYPSISNFTGFQGIQIEDYYLNELNNNEQFKCIPCTNGCTECYDDRPCEFELMSSFKLTALFINIICILLCLILIIFTWYNLKLQMLKTSSPKMLFMVLIGSIVSYSEIIPIYFKPSNTTCLIAQILQLEGFLMAYGALVLRTWRECKLFYVKNVKIIKITDKSLFKRLLIIMLIGSTYLGIWSGMSDRPMSENIQINHSSLNYKTCNITQWNFISMGSKLILNISSLTPIHKFLFKFN